MPPTPPQAQRADMTVTVTRSVPKAVTARTGVESEPGQEQLIETKLFATTPAMVKASIGRTINLGNFESIKIEVGVTMPVYSEEVPDAMDYVSDLVSNYVQREEDALRQLLAQAKSSKA